MNQYIINILEFDKKIEKYVEDFATFSKREKEETVEEIHDIVVACSQPYQNQNEFDESTGRGYRCIHCEIRNNVCFCHYHDAPIKNQREWTTDELIEHERYAADAEREKVLGEVIIEIDNCWRRMHHGNTTHHHHIKRQLFLRFRKVVEELRGEQ